jgi:hypothetical protein
MDLFEICGGRGDNDDGETSGEGSARTDNLLLRKDDRGTVVKPCTKDEVESFAEKDMDNRKRKAARTPLGSRVFFIVAILWHLMVSCSVLVAC